MMRGRAKDLTPVMTQHRGAPAREPRHPADTKQDLALAGHGVGGPRSRTEVNMARRPGSAPAASAARLSGPPDASAAKPTGLAGSRAPLRSLSSSGAPRPEGRTSLPSGSDSLAIGNAASARTGSGGGTSGRLAASPDRATPAHISRFASHRAVGSANRIGDVRSPARSARAAPAAAPRPDAPALTPESEMELALWRASSSVRPTPDTATDGTVRAWRQRATAAATAAGAASGGRTGPPAGWLAQRSVPSAGVRMPTEAPATVSAAADVQAASMGAATATRASTGGAAGDVHLLLPGGAGRLGARPTAAPLAWCDEHADSGFAPAAASRHAGEVGQAGQDVRNGDYRRSSAGVNDDHGQGSAGVNGDYRQGSADGGSESECEAEFRSWLARRQRMLNAGMPVGSPPMGAARAASQNRPEPSQKRAGPSQNRPEPVGRFGHRDALGRASVRGAQGWLSEATWAESRSAPCAEAWPESPPSVSYSPPAHSYKRATPCYEHACPRSSSAAPARWAAGAGTSVAHAPVTHASVTCVSVTRQQGAAVKAGSDRRARTVEYRGERLDGSNITGRGQSTVRAAPADAPASQDASPSPPLLSPGYRGGPAAGWLPSPPSRRLSSSPPASPPVACSLASSVASWGTNVTAATACRWYSDAGAPSQPPPNEPPHSSPPSRSRLEPTEPACTPPPHTSPPTPPLDPEPSTALACGEAANASVSSPCRSGSATHPPTLASSHAQPILSPTRSAHGSEEDRAGCAAAAPGTPRPSCPCRAHGGGVSATHIGAPARPPARCPPPQLSASSESPNRTAGSPNSTADSPNRPADPPSRSADYQNSLADVSHPRPPLSSLVNRFRTAAPTPPGSSERSAVLSAKGRAAGSSGDSTTPSAADITTEPITPGAATPPGASTPSAAGTSAAGSLHDDRDILESWRRRRLDESYGQSSGMDSQSWMERTCGGCIGAEVDGSASSGVFDPEPSIHRQAPQICRYQDQQAGRQREAGAPSASAPATLNPPPLAARPHAALSAEAHRTVAGHPTVSAAPHRHPAPSDYETNRSLVLDSLETRTFEALRRRWLSEGGEAFHHDAAHQPALASPADLFLQEAEQANTWDTVGASDIDETQSSRDSPASAAPWLCSPPSAASPSLPACRACASSPPRGAAQRPTNCGYTDGTAGAPPATLSPNSRLLSHALLSADGTEAVRESQEVLAAQLRQIQERLRAAAVDLDVSFDSASQMQMGSPMHSPPGGLDATSPRWVAEREWMVSPEHASVRVGHASFTPPPVTPSSPRLEQNATPRHSPAAQLTPSSPRLEDNTTPRLEASPQPTPSSPLLEDNITSRRRSSPAAPPTVSSPRLEDNWSPVLQQEYGMQAGQLSPAISPLSSPESPWLQHNRSPGTSPGASASLNPGASGGHCPSEPVTGASCGSPISPDQPTASPPRAAAASASHTFEQPLHGESSPPWSSPSPPGSSGSSSPSPAHSSASPLRRSAATQQSSPSSAIDASVFLAGAPTSHGRRSPPLAASSDGAPPRPRASPSAFGSSPAHAPAATSHPVPTQRGSERGSPSGTSHPSSPMSSPTPCRLDARVDRAIAHLVWSHIGEGSGPCIVPHMECRSPRSEQQPDPTQVGRHGQAGSALPGQPAEPRPACYQDRPLPRDESADDKAELAGTLRTMPSGAARHGAVDSCGADYGTAAAHFAEGVPLCASDGLGSPLRCPMRWDEILTDEEEDDETDAELRRLKERIALCKAQLHNRHADAH